MWHVGPVLLTGQHTSHKLQIMVAVKALLWLVVLTAQTFNFSQGLDKKEAASLYDILKKFYDSQGWDEEDFPPHDAFYPEDLPLPGGNGYYPQEPYYPNNQPSHQYPYPAYPQNLQYPGQGQNGPGSVPAVIEHVSAQQNPPPVYRPKPSDQPQGQNHSPSNQLPPGLWPPSIQGGSWPPQPQGENWPPKPQGGYWQPQPQGGYWPSQPQGGNWQPQPQGGNSPPQPQGGNWPPQPQDGYWQPQPQGGNSPPQPQGGYWQPQPQGGNWQPQPQGGNWPSQPQGGNWPSQPQGGNWPSQPQGGNWPSQPQGGNQPNQPQGGNQPNQPQGGNQPSQPQGGYQPQPPSQGGQCPPSGWRDLDPTFKCGQCSETDLVDRNYQEGRGSKQPHNEVRCGYASTRSRFLSVLRALDDVKRGAKIIGGQLSSLEQFPWLVAVGNVREGPQCGGSLIHPEWVLTAAHCFQPREKLCDILVRVGDFDLSSRKEKHEDIHVTQILTYKGFNRQLVGSPYDIALIKLARPATVANSNINNLCLPAETDNFPVGTNCITAGWGDKTGHQQFSDQVRWINIPILDLRSDCANYIRGLGTANFNANNHICAGTTNGKKGSCSGDSGGPLFCQLNSGGPYVQAGVVSFGGEQCGTSGYPSVFTNVKKYVPWINDVIQRYR